MGFSTVHIGTISTGFMIWTLTPDRQEIYLSLRPPASPDPALNPRLSAILAKAREVGYPKSNVDTAMNKVSPRRMEMKFGSPDQSSNNNRPLNLNLNLPLDPDYGSESKNKRNSSQQFLPSPNDNKNSDPAL